MLVFSSNLFWNLSLEIKSPLSLITILEFFSGWSLCGITNELSVPAPQKRLKNTDLVSVWESTPGKIQGRLQCLFTKTSANPFKKSERDGVTVGRTVLMSIIYMNLNVNQRHELRSTFHFPGPGWKGSADSGEDLEPSSDTASLPGRPSPSPLVRSLLCGIIGPNHFWLWDDPIFILRESIPVWKWKIK